MFEDSGSLLLLMNALLYLSLFIWYNGKKKQFDLGWAILLIFSISSATSVFYYRIDYVRAEFTGFEVLPFLFLFLCFFVAVRPILSFDFRKVVKINSAKNQRLLTVLSIMLSLIGLEIFFEHLMQIIRVPISFNSDSVGKIYEGDVDATAYMSWIGRKFNYILTLFQLAVPILLFHAISRGKKYIVYGLILVILGNILSAYNAGSRGRVLFIVSCCITSYFFMKHTLPEGVIKKVKTIMLVSFVLIVIGFAAMTLSRYLYSGGSYRNSVWEWVGLYSGEGFIRFNCEMWHFDSFLMGDNSFPLFFDTSIDMDDYVDTYFSKYGFRLNVFYTFVGDFVMDYGLLGALFICMIISVILKYFLSRNKLGFHIHHIIILVTLSQIFLFGFSAYIYRGSSFFIMLVPNLVLAYLLKSNERLRFV